MELLISRTKINLLKAFAGESQAYNRYTFAASQCKTRKLTVLQQAFLLTAQQEQEHAKVFYNFLKQCGDVDIAINADYPVDCATEPEQMLRRAHQHEHKEHSEIYPSYAQDANQEGFDKIAAAFFAIAEIEKTHGDRFLRIANAISDNSLFHDKSQQGFMCLNCGHIHLGTDAPTQCPVCQHDRGYFVRASFAPFLGA